MKSLVKTLIAPFVLATALLFSPIKANTPQTEKINSPANAEQVVQMGKYQRWKINNVWYSNAPLEIASESNLKSLSKTSTDYEDIRMNPFSQPNDSTLSYYGSGDVDSNNVLDWSDHQLIQQGVQNDQSDIDGDGISGTTTDAELLAKYLNGDTLLPQINWNWSMVSKEQRKKWLEKMLAIDKTDTITYTDDFMCGNFAKQIMINFKGFNEIEEDSSLLEKIDPLNKYDFSNNGRFNLFVGQVHLRNPNHSINACLIGNNPLNWEDWYFIEPQKDNQVKIGDWDMSENAEVYIYHSFFFYNKSTSKFYFGQEPFIEFKLTNSVPELIKYDNRLILNPNVKIESDLEKNARNFKLNQNYPNPANQNTTIKYSIPLEDKVKLQVYDITGKLVKTLVNENQRAGEYKVDLNASGFSSGIYLYRIETSAGIQTKKMSVLK